MALAVTLALAPMDGVPVRCSRMKFLVAICNHITLELKWGGAEEEEEEETTGRGGGSEVTTSCMCLVCRFVFIFCLSDPTVHSCDIGGVNDVGALWTI